ncbi:MAG: phosphoglucosamine mutase [Alphaproteobacteria bacterium]|nr:phosphoglucosamine mutase [Alphaproteobacteria bacterium]
MTRDIFGTDGIRGTANIEPMTAATALRVAMATGHRFLRGDHRHLVVIGKDTRLSGYMLEPAMTAGFISMGMDVVLVGPLPTPAVAMLTRSLRADLGVVLSASHNPYQDNGIKLFGPEGYKLSDTVEREIEERMDNGVEEHLAASGQLGKAMRLDDAQGRYIEYVKNTFPKGLRLDGMKVVIDCAHGAAYRVAPLVLWELGAEVIPMGTQPDGFNINHDCGATEPQAMCAKVVDSKADIGIALDGDADRLIISDEKGKVIDGDQIMALVAMDWKNAGHLRGDALVATVMSNMGLERYLASLDLGLVRAQVGDRYVVETMRSGGHNVGGEQSGHIILSDYSTTGDGLIAALQVLSVLVKTGRPASEVARCFDPFPQMLRSVSFNGTEPLENSEVKAAIAEGEAKLAGNGRLVIRKSGTEPLVRVMAEAEDEAVVGGVVNRIVEVIERVSG